MTQIHLSESEKTIVAAIANLDACCSCRWGSKDIWRVGMREYTGRTKERWVYIHFTDGGCWPIHLEEWRRLMAMARAQVAAGAQVAADA